LKLDHPGQGIREEFWWKIRRLENFMEVKVYKILGRIKKLK
jgi:hypothetical protein